GFDIRFYSDITLLTSLSFELERFVATTGQIIFWIKVPSLSSSADTTIYIAYGDAALNTNASSTATWDSNYKAVYHFGDGSTVGLNDSTSNANTLTNHGATATTGQVYGAVNLVAASLQYLDHASFVLGTTSLTVEAWIFSTNFSQDG